jgi:predicted N-acyltransferase
MATEAAPSGQGRSPGLPLTCEHHPAIDPVAAAWDRLVPRDLPHLRAGFLRAAERGGMIPKPDYLLLYQGGRPVAAAVTYELLVDAAQGASPRRRAWVNWVRKWYRGYSYRPLRVCGSPISNGEGGVHFDPALSAAARRQAFARIADEVLRVAGRGPTYYFKEFSDEAVAEYASELEKLGFFPVEPSPGTRLAIRWKAFDEYVNAMRTKYRHQLKKDLKAGEGLEFALLDAFAELAPQATRLYKNVVAHAEAALQVAGETFFAAVSDFEQARLLVARVRGTGELVGVVLLLFGDTAMHNIYIGFDYEQNKRYRTYFNLLEQSLRCAIDRGCRVAYFGQTAYDFKARLGAEPFPLTAYVKHRIGFVHKMLLANKDQIFPKTEGAVSSPVFRADGEEEP